MPSTRSATGSDQTRRPAGHAAGDRAAAGQRAGGILNTARQVGYGEWVRRLGALLANQATFLNSLRTSLLITVVLLLATAAASLLLKPAPQE